MEVEVKDRDTGEPVRLNFRTRGPSQHSLDNFCVSPKQMISEALRGALLEFCIHEVDECIIVDGERANDPHKAGYDPHQLRNGSPYTMY